MKFDSAFVIFGYLTFFISNQVTKGLRLKMV